MQPEDREALAQRSMQGDASGAPREGEVWLVGEFEDDQFPKMAYFLDRETARTAAEAGG